MAGEKDIFYPAYRDELGPAFSFGSGAAAPSVLAFAGAAGPNAIRGLTFGPGDSVDVIIQMNHDVQIPTAGNVSFDAHVHWTAIAAPAAAATLIWEFEYISAKPSIDGSSVFSNTSTPLTGATITLDGNELRKHYLTDIGHIDIPVASYGPSHIIWGVFRMKATSSVAAGKIALLAFDLHKVVNSLGTASEYV